MRRRNQPVIVPADVENQHRAPAADFYGVRIGISPPHFHQVAPHCRLDRLAPNVQVTGRRRMCPPCRHEERFFNDAHADNLYSFQRFVKCKKTPGSIAESGAPIPAAPKLPSEGWSESARTGVSCEHCRIGVRRSGGSEAVRRNTSLPLRRTGVAGIRGAGLRWCPSGLVAGVTIWMSNKTKPRHRGI
jgi:hypothetical protein